MTTRKPMPAFGGSHRPAPGFGTTPPKAQLIIFTNVKDNPVIVNLKSNMTIGREVHDSHPDIPINSKIVSRKHGSFSVSSGGFFYEDSDSFNGTFVNGTLYKHDRNPCTSPIQLKDGDILRIDCADSKTSHPEAVTIVFSLTYDKRSKWRREKPKTATLPIGISNKNLVAFDQKTFSVQNAIAKINPSSCTVAASTKRNNVFHNNCPTSEFTIKNKGVFRIDNNFFYYESGEFLYNVCLVTEPGMNVRLAETHVMDKMHKKVLLKDVNLNIDKGDFALIIGGSGAGKSTFMNSILGKYNIVGKITIGGKEASGNSDLTSAIAYVPQTLPIRKEEKLIDVVTDTCILRCKKKMNAKQRKKFIMDTLESLGLAGKAKMEIKKLSGGEQRRAAIANEVVTDSDIFFLDEPDSGLDPKSGMELMTNLKALSDNGKMVMLISHNYASYPNPESIYTKIIILAKSNRDGIGRLAFCGTVKEALEFFEVESLKDITKLINPVSENGEGRADEFVDKFRRMNSYE